MHTIRYTPGEREDALARAIAQGGVTKIIKEQGSGRFLRGLATLPLT